MDNENSTRAVQISLCAYWERECLERYRQSNQTFKQITKDRGFARAQREKGHYVEKHWLDLASELGEL
jgi:hypothetical protein